MFVPRGDESALTLALALNGPISIAIDASQDSFQFYEQGVYSEKKCSSKELDHAVLAVGYGVHKGTPYYLVKNSWGSTWGQGGYIMMTRDGSNQCGIATDGILPLVSPYLKL
jgi:cathepsin L